MENKININNQDEWNYCHNFPLLQLLGVNHCLPLLHMSKNFVCIHNTEEHINKLAIGCMVS